MGLTEERACDQQKSRRHHSVGGGTPPPLAISLASKTLASASGLEDTSAALHEETIKFISIMSDGDIPEEEEEPSTLSDKSEGRVLSMAPERCTHTRAKAAASAARDLA